MSTSPVGTLPININTTSSTNNNIVSSDDSFVTSEAVMIANYSLNNQTESISLDDEICSSELMSSFPNVSDCPKKKKIWMVAEGLFGSEFLKWCLSRKAFNNALRKHELLRALHTKRSVTNFLKSAQNGPYFYASFTYFHVMFKSICILLFQATYM